MKIEKSFNDFAFRGQRSLIAEEVEGGISGGEFGECGVLEGRGSEVSVVLLVKRKNILVGVYFYFGLVKREGYNFRGLVQGWEYCKDSYFCKF